MRVLELAPEVYASGQLFETDLQLLSRQRVRSIVSTRPDDEVAGQPSAEDLATAAEEIGITFLHFPLEPASMTRETAAAFMDACEDLERPVLVCGRSGAYTTRIWETAESLSAADFRETSPEQR